MNFVMMPVPENMFSAVCALLSGSTAAEAKAPVVEAKAPAAEAKAPAAEAKTPAAEEELDAEGNPWQADLHSPKKTKTKAGVWRMKRDAAKPAPNSTLSETSTASPATPAVNTATEPAGSTQTEEPASAVALPDEEDEFAAFTAAAEKSSLVDPDRIYSLADVGMVCNQAAEALNDPAPVRELIKEFVPGGEVAHSRNIPENLRAEFVARLEEVAGIQFAG